MEASKQLQIASTVCLQITEIFYTRSKEAFEELEIYRSSDGAVMGDRDFAPFIRQSMNIDFEEFVEPLVSTIRKPYTQSEDDEPHSIVEIVDKQVLLETLAETSPQEEYVLLTEIAYEENVSDWVEVVSNYFTVANTQTTTWYELKKSLNIAPVEIFLGLLLGTFELNQIQNESSCFYEREILVEIQ